MGDGDVHIYEAKTNFSRLLHEVAQGNEVLIANAGEPVAQIISMPKKETPRRRVFGQNVMGITYIAPDAFDPLPREIWGDLLDDEADGKK